MNWFLRIFIMLVFLGGSEGVFARQKPAPSCSPAQAITSMYFLPDVRDYCKGEMPCAAFKSAVRMQGSGTLPGNRILTSRGKELSLGSCSTAFGAGNECLLPFISIAADPKLYQMGDIIQIPSMANRLVTLPNGKQIRHPGYFIVHDTGGAIQGRNRFDFFTGSFDLAHKKNAFGYEGFSDLKIAEKGDCSEKRFSILRLGTSRNASAKRIIDSVLSQVKSHEWTLSATSSQGTR